MDLRPIAIIEEDIADIEELIDLNLLLLEMFPIDLVLMYNLEYLQQLHQDLEDELKNSKYAAAIEELHGDY